MQDFAQLNEAPNYSPLEAAIYLRLPIGNVRRWIKDGIISAPDAGISFLNLLEMHVLKGLRKECDLPLQRIRRAMDEYRETENSKHPLLDKRLETDGIHLFLHEGDEYWNLNRPKQRGIPQILSTYLKRIDGLGTNNLIFFPFIVGENELEPRTIQISPKVAFGRPVLSHTGISTEVIAGRFRARDSIADLAEEYGVESTSIEDAIRWELPHLNAA